MPKRTWEINIKGQSHIVRLDHGYSSGKCEIWLDDQLIVKEKKLYDYGSQHRFSIEGESCELGIITNGITFDYYLLVGKTPISAKEDSHRRLLTSAIQNAYSESLFWQKLTILTGLDDNWKSGLNGFGRHRLIGYIRDYLVIITGGKAQQAATRIISILIRHAPIDNNDPARAKLKADLLAKQVTTQKQYLKKHTGVETSFSVITLPYSPQKDDAEAIFKKINTIVHIVSKYASPLPRNVCEGPTCKQRVGQDLHLTLINNYLVYLCGDCIKEIPLEAKRREEEHLKASPDLLKGVSAGIITAILCGFPWALVAFYLDRVTAFFSVLIFLAVMKAMTIAGAKLTKLSLLLDGLITMAGIVWGVYLTIILNTIKHTRAFTLETFQLAWQTMGADRGLLVFSLLIGFIVTVPFMWDIWSNHKLRLTRAYNPNVEIVEPTNSL